MNWREWFAGANNKAWQAVDVPEPLVEEFSASGRPNSTECMYQAFKARLLEETTSTSE